MDIQNRIEAIIAPVLQDEGYGVVRILFSGNIRKTLQIMIEKLDDTPIQITDCEKVSRLISPILDVENVARESYNLEVSSPGINRPLVKPAHFERYIGENVSVQTNYAIKNRKKFQGTLDFVSKTGIRITLDHLSDDKTQEIELLFDDIRHAQLQRD